MGKFEITKRFNGEYQFNLKANNGQIILVSEGYSSKSGCTNGIESVRKNSQDDKQFQRKTSSNDKPYFVLKAGNGQIIGNSEMYETTASRDNGIESVKKNAYCAEVFDLTIGSAEVLIKTFKTIDVDLPKPQVDKEEPFQSFNSDDLSLFLDGRKELEEITVMQFLKSVKIHHPNVLKEFLQENKDLCV